MSKQTRSANGSGTIRKRADGRWEGIYSAGYDQQTGKLIRKSIYGKNQKEVRQKLSKVTTEIDEGLYLEPAKMTLSDWMDLWYKEYTFDKKYSTLKGYKAQINKHIRPGIGKYNLSQLNPMILQRFFNHLSEPNEKGKVLSPKSIKATPHNSARADFEKNWVLMKAVFRRNTLCIARKSDKIRARFFRKMPKADCAVLP